MVPILGAGSLEALFQLIGPLFIFQSPYFQLGQQGPYFIKSWVHIGSLFLSLEVPINWNSAYWLTLETFIWIYTQWAGQI